MIFFIELGVLAREFFHIMEEHLVLRNGEDGGFFSRDSSALPDEE
jgi:hypothetical protein